MAMKKSSFNLLPDVPDVKQTEDNNSVTDVTPTNNGTQPQQTSNVTLVTQPTYVTQERKRIYVSISMDHYNHAKKECGATGITLQEYFDRLIEKDMLENEPHYR